jgi:hypothetical protein
MAGLLDQPRTQVLLQGLVSRSRPLPQHGVCALGHVFDLHVGHGAILAPKEPKRNTETRAAGELAAAWQRTALQPASDRRTLPNR